MAQHTKPMLKVPLFLKLLEHSGYYERAHKKWKGDQTIKAVSNFLAAVQPDVAAKYIKIIVDQEDMPSVNSMMIFTHYRDAKYRREQQPYSKGRLPNKNVMMVDPFGTVREQIPSRQYRCVRIRSVDIERMAAEDASD